MKKLSPIVLSSFNSALQKLTGSKRRSFAAELCETFFDSSPRKMERYMKVSRDMVRLGMDERQANEVCSHKDSYNKRGAKKKK